MSEQIGINVVKGCEHVTYTDHNGKPVTNVISRLYRYGVDDVTKQYVVAIEVRVGSFAIITTDSGKHYIPWFNVIEWFRRAI
ncbi:MAG TPA: hypothetical protein VN039_03845 [Nitrospira sp.]|nr:hypothetical protein [Nitrospira sp.]